MLASIARLGPDGASDRALGSAHFGCRHWHCLPEDEFDRQPYVGQGGHVLLAADARVDNRSEIERALELSPQAAASTSDAELIAAAWERFGLGLFDRLLGDVALAVWNAAEGQLTLARAPLSTRPLFVHRAPGFLAFASTPSALLALPGVERRPNFDQFALMMSGKPYLPGGLTPFDGIEAVPQGHALIFRQGGRESRRLWLPDTAEPVVRAADAGEALRAELDRAVRAQLRRRGGLVACQLSSGRDSSAVAASAAPMERDAGRTIVAVTAAPRMGFRYPDRQWLADESEVAATVAERHGMRHLVCRTEQDRLIGLLEQVSREDHHPFVNAANLPWLAQTCREATDHGASVLLSGAFGNAGLSLGGLGFLGDYRREQGFGQWWRLARQLRRRGVAGWPSVLGSTYGHYVPGSVYAAGKMLAGRIGPERWALPLLNSPYREQAERIRRTRLHTRPPASQRRSVGETLMKVEAEDRYSLVNGGLDVRDPTADRRLIELCLSLPADCLTGAEQPRPAYAAAFGDRLPLDKVGAKRGFQAADWNEATDPQHIRLAFQHYTRHPLVRAYFDLAAIDRAIERWPSGASYLETIYDLCCNQLLGALSLASFIDAQFPA